VSDKRSLGDEEIAMVPSLTTFEDSALIQLALAGENECFMVLANRYLPSVRKRIAAMVRNSADVDDLLQGSY
jgi:hypothetical protein